MFWNNNNFRLVLNRRIKPSFFVYLLSFPLPCWLYLRKLKLGPGYAPLFQPIMSQGRRDIVIRSWILMLILLSDGINRLFIFIPAHFMYIRNSNSFSRRQKSGTVDKIGKNGFQFPENKFGQFSQSDSLKGLSQPNCIYKRKYKTEC